MKIVHISTNDIGGAAQATKRLHVGLIQAGVSSTFFSKINHHTNLEAHTSMMGNKSWRHYWDYGLQHYVLKNIFPPNRGYSKDTVLFTSPHSLYHPERSAIVSQADLIHLHWTSNFINYLPFFKKINKPVVWTLHDMNPFTGGCHYSGDCKKYINGCTDCPQIQETNQPQAATKYFRYKQESLEIFTKLAVVTPSQWMYDQSCQSLLLKRFPHHIIRNGCEDSVFKVLDKKSCKVKFGLPEGKINLLFVAHSLNAPMKGLSTLIEALKSFPKNLFHLTLVGKGTFAMKLDNLSYSSLGYIQDENKMAEIYNAADLFITPSVRDNQPNTIIESQLCGLPVLGFKTQGIAEMVTEGLNGILAEPLNADGITNGIKYFLQHQTHFDPNQIHQKAKDDYELSKTVRQYLEIYRGLLA